MLHQQERAEPPAEALGLLGVDETPGPHSRVARERVAGDHPPAVVPDDRERVESQEVDGLLLLRQVAGAAAADDAAARRLGVT